MQQHPPLNIMIKEEKMVTDSQLENKESRATIVKSNVTTPLINTMIIEEKWQN